MRPRSRRNRRCLPALHPHPSAAAGNEPYELWEGLKPGSPEYEAMKDQRSQCLWAALERVIPDVRARTELKLVASPLTHERFVRRYKGTYGPAISAREGAFPGPGTPLPGLYRCVARPGGVRQCLRAPQSGRVACCRCQDLAGACVPTPPTTPHLATARRAGVATAARPASACLLLRPAA